MTAIKKNYNVYFTIPEHRMDIFFKKSCPKTAPIVFEIIASKPAQRVHTHIDAILFTSWQALAHS